MAPVQQGPIVWAFGWAPVRRDFLAVLTGSADRNAGVVSWLAESRAWSQRNAARRAAWTAAAAAVDGGTLASGHRRGPPPLANDHPPAAVPRSAPPPTGAAAEQQRRQHVAHLAQRRDAEWQQPDRPAVCTQGRTSWPKQGAGRTVFLDHPEVPWDNNAAERAERRPVVARKNY